MAEGLTQPVRLDGAESPQPWQEHGEGWSIDSAHGIVIRKQQDPEEGAAPALPFKNSGSVAHLSTQAEQDARPSERKLVGLQSEWVGLRSFVPEYQWEGTVERVEGDRFFCRIVALQEGSEAQATTLEQTEFSFDDLSSESDVLLVKSGAVFYWTIGRSRNAAGTISKRSLLRFRRLPPLTELEVRESEREAEALLRALSGENGSDAAAQ